jgi:hypothetical protein
MMSIAIVAEPASLYVFHHLPSAAGPVYLKLEFSADFIARHLKQAHSSLHPQIPLCLVVSPRPFPGH